MRPNAGDGARDAEKEVDLRVVFSRQSWQGWELTDEGNREGEPRTAPYFKKHLHLNFIFKLKKRLTGLSRVFPSTNSGGDPQPLVGSRAAVRAGVWGQAHILPAPSL